MKALGALIALTVAWVVAASSLARAQAPAQPPPAKRMVLFDQDCAGPGGTDMLSLLLLLQSPVTDVLGVTVVTGDAWRDEEVQHALRLLELVGRSDIPVVPGAAAPLVRTKEQTLEWERLYGKQTYLGAWSDGPRSHGPSEVPPMREGNPAAKAADEDAAHFLVRTVRAHPHQVTIYAGGPLTNIALAISIDPQFAELTNGIAMMGTSINPHTDSPEFADDPRHEFNVRAHWTHIEITTVDVSIQTELTQPMFDQIARVQTPAAQYVAKYDHPKSGPQWDELAAAALLDPSIISRRLKTYMDINLDRGASYGNVLTWSEKGKPDVGVQMVDAQVDVDVKKFDDLFVKLLTAATPGAHNPQMLKER
jgi:purine nucleosidase